MVVENDEVLPARMGPRSISPAKLVQIDVDLISEFRRNVGCKPSLGQSSINASNGIPKNLIAVQPDRRLSPMGVQRKMTLALTARYGVSPGHPLISVATNFWFV